MMKSIDVFRMNNRGWHFLPAIAVRRASVSLIFVLTLLFGIDRIALPRLEEQGMTSGSLWQKHNELVVTEHRKKDTSVPIEIPEVHQKEKSVDSHTTGAQTFGVRSWTGHSVTEHKSTACRILVMGDSFVWGSPYLTLNHMWWRQLEIELRGRGFDVEVIAAGQPGAATRDQITSARILIPRYRPDLVIWGYVTNDPDEGLIKQISWSQQSLPGFNRVRVALGRIWPRLVAKFDSLRSIKLEKSYTGPRFGYEYGEWELKLVEPTNLAVYEKTVQQVRQIMDEHRLPGFMMTLPNYPSTRHFNPRFDPVIPIWQRAGVTVHNSLPAFVKQFGEFEDTGNATVDWGINPADGHPGPRACRFLAIQAADVIEQKYSGALGSRSRSETNHIEINDWLPFTSPDEQPKQINDHSWTMTYPAESRCISMPIRTPAYLIALKEPALIKQLVIEGEAIKTTQVWVTCVDAVERFDDGHCHDLGQQNGTITSWQLPDRAISTIRINISFQGTARDFTLTAQPGNRGQR